MDPRRRHLLLVGAFAALLALHVWLLLRSLYRGEPLLAILLAVAAGLFVHRIAHHLGQARGRMAVAVDRETERRRIRLWSIVLVLLLPVHAWLLLSFLASGDAALAALVAVALGLMVYRIGVYARRAMGLRTA